MNHNSVILIHAAKIDEIFQIPLRRIKIL